jgi:hypothetical protein
MKSIRHRFYAIKCNLDSFGHGLLIADHAILQWEQVQLQSRHFYMINLAQKIYVGRSVYFSKELSEYDRRSFLPNQADRILADILLSPTTKNTVEEPVNFLESTVWELKNFSTSNSKLYTELVGTRFHIDEIRRIDDIY